MMGRYRVFLPVLQRGLTLIELMVALVMGLVLLAGVVTVFIANKQTYRFQDALARLQENGRFAVTLLDRDIRRAGGFICGNLSIEQIEVRNNLNQNYPYVWSFGEAVQGNDASTPTGTSFACSNWNPQLDASICSNSAFTPKPLPGTDVLTLRAAWDTGIKVLKQPGGVPGGASLQVTPKAPLCESDVLLVTDCLNSGTVFQVSQLQVSSGHHSNVIHNTGAGQEAPGNAKNGFHVNYAGRGQIVRPATRVYYVADTGRGIPALYRAEFGGGNSNCSAKGKGTAGSWAGGEVYVEELVEGVEDFQVLYGLDTDGDGAVDVDGYRKASDIATDEWRDVRSVRVALLLQSADSKALSAIQTFDMRPQTTGDGANLFEDTSQIHLFNVFEGSGGIPSTDRRWRQPYFTNVTVRNRAP
jgi:type IV pilus assembly protein PilW